MKWKEKIKEINMRNCEADAKTYRDSPRKTEWTFIVCISMTMGVGILVAMLGLIGYVIQELTISQLGVTMVIFTIHLSFTIWFLRYRKKIIKLAFPNGAVLSV